MSRPVLGQILVKWKILCIFQKDRDEDKISSEENVWFGFRVSSKELKHHRWHLYVFFKTWKSLSQYHLWLVENSYIKYLTIFRSFIRSCDVCSDIFNNSSAALSPYDFMWVYYIIEFIESTFTRDCLLSLRRTVHFRPRPSTVTSAQFIY